MMNLSSSGSTKFTLVKRTGNIPLRKEVISTPQSIERSAFCATRPTPEEVTRTLAPLSFVLTFTMGAQKASATVAPYALPAQYHHAGPHGVEVIYLAGPDWPIRSLPPHEARFWCYASDAAHEVAQQVMETLSRVWSLTWHDAHAYDEDAA